MTPPIDRFRCQLQPPIARPIRPHRHPFYEFHYISGGDGTFDLAGQGLPVHKGDFFFQAPEQLHAMVPGRTPVEQYVCFLTPDPDDRSSLDLLAKLTAGRIFSLGESSQALFEGLRYLTHSNNDHYERAAALQFLSLLHRLAGDLQRNTLACYHPGVERALALIHASGERPVTLEELSAAAKLERAYFAHLFADQVGVPPMRYVMNLKIERAKELLRDPALPLKGIAEKLGFADVYHFSKRFKESAGVSPGRWRRGS